MGASLPITNEYNYNLQCFTTCRDSYLTSNAVREYAEWLGPATPKDRRWALLKVERAEYPEQLDKGPETRNFWVYVQGVKSSLE